MAVKHPYRKPNTDFIVITETSSSFFSYLLVLPRFFFVITLTFLSDANLSEYWGFFRHRKSIFRHRKFFLDKKCQVENPQELNSFPKADDGICSASSHLC